MATLRLIAAALLAIAIPAAAYAQAGVQLYQGAWLADSFGNDNVGGASESEFFSAAPAPIGHVCNADQPRCPFASTPVSAIGGDFSPLGTICTPISAFGTATRPAKGASGTTGMAVRYRNPGFFSAGGAPLITACSGVTTIGGDPATAYLSAFDPLRGLQMGGSPLTGSGQATVTTAVNPPGINFAAAPATPTAGPTGFRKTAIGSFGNDPPYVYSYTYATLRNASGVFNKGAGPGNFSIPYKKGGGTVAKAVVKQGANQFGGVMALLGQMTTKVCYFRNGGCSLGDNNWRYEAVGTSAYTSGGVVTQGYLALYSAMYYHTLLMQTSTIMVIGSRFPWTTGTATVTATGRGPHKTIARRKGFDNRNTTGSQIGQGTVQMVTPIVTKWLQPAVNFETAGVGVMRLTFVPEPSQWALLVAGVSLIGVAYRVRGR